jgi:hypothetical protein
MWVFQRPTLKRLNELVLNFTLKIETTYWKITELYFREQNLRKWYVTASSLQQYYCSTLVDFGKWQERERVRACAPVCNRAWWALPRPLLCIHLFFQNKKCVCVSLLPTTRIHIIAGFPPRRPGSDHMGFVVDKVALGQVSSKYFGFPCHLHSTNCSTITIVYHLRLVQ